MNRQNQLAENTRENFYNEAPAPQKPLACQEITSLIGREPYREPVFCGSEFDVKECIHCGDGVCIRCTVSCYQCGERLHEDCRDQHERKSGHMIDAPNCGDTIASLEKIVDGRL